MNEISGYVCLPGFRLGPRAMEVPGLLPAPRPHAVRLFSEQLPHQPSFDRGPAAEDQTGKDDSGLIFMWVTRKNMMDGDFEVALIMVAPPSLRPR